jgi:nanoRNase/pAp phosphatase (c-di-AMP/oligoRNAs hydrolase)
LDIRCLSAAMVSRHRMSLLALQIFNPLMILDPQEQLKNFLEKSKEVLLLIPESPSGDAIGSAWALYFFLKGKNINATIAFANHFPEKFSFLPRPENIQTEISGARDFVLSFDTSRNKIKNLRTEKTDGKFVIYLTPEKGTLDPRDFSFILAKFKYDLVIVIDSPDLDRLGKIHESNPDLFFEVPVVNIDHRSENENFGQINLVDTTASSCSEIVTHFLGFVDPDAIDQKVAECLLSGIISATDSFQKKNTTPKALLASAGLMDKGADQQKIIHWLYKTHPLPLLKLWGRAMSKLRWEENLKLAWAEITLEDFVQSRSNPEQFPAVLEKLQESYSEGEMFMLLRNKTPETVSAFIKIIQPELLEKIHKALGGQIKKDILETEIPVSDLAQAGEMIKEKIKNLLSA